MPRGLIPVHFQNTPPPPHPPPDRDSENTLFWTFFFSGALRAPFLSLSCGFPPFSGHLRAVSRIKPLIPVQIFFWRASRALAQPFQPYRYTSSGEMNRWCAIEKSNSKDRLYPNPRPKTNGSCTGIAPVPNIVLIALPATTIRQNCSGIREVKSELPPKAARRKNWVYSVIPPFWSFQIASKVLQIPLFLFQNSPRFPAPDSLIPEKSSNFSLIPVDSRNPPPPTPLRPEQPRGKKFTGIRSYEWSRFLSQRRNFDIRWQNPSSQNVL